ncbi:type II secretion system protein GspJ [Maliponia aquimaris]|uniref:Type II secretion system protein J n=1 Tax=Maliponia aquimaris TaxID=1673631 RepID=A0A238KD65_9RHOB|nr:type II secretion system protein GspJ [Maliponia aquimaris]SMX40798.1 Pseudopilin GspJ [Maliponia aquimaris]
MRRGDRGLSLIELVVAMVLFALVAVMGLTTLNGTIRSRDALTLRDDRDRALAVTLALLRTDLDRLAPVLFYPPEAPPQSALHADPAAGRIGLSIAAPTADGGHPFQRAEWRLDRATGTLSRSSWPVVTPARADQHSAERAFLTGVTALRLRSYWGGLGWVEGGAAALLGGVRPPTATDGDAAFGLVANTYSDILPIAIEITLTHDTLGEIRIVEAMQ